VDAERALDEVDRGMLAGHGRIVEREVDARASAEGHAFVVELVLHARVAAGEDHDPGLVGVEERLFVALAPSGLQLRGKSVTHGCSPRVGDVEPPRLNG
jgi:hypothetical protein